MPRLLLAFTRTLALGALTVNAVRGTKVILSNDDGWAATNIRAVYAALGEAGYETILSAPAVNQSGTSSLEFPPLPVLQGCEFGSCPAGAPAYGSNATDPHITYVNSFPATAMSYGISTTAPKLWGGAAPDVAVAGPNIGSNLGLDTLVSGTIGATCKAASLSIPALAFSGTSGAQLSYTTLSTAPSSPSSLAATFYASAAAAFLTAFLANASAPSVEGANATYSTYLPPGTALNINYPAYDGTDGTGMGCGAGGPEALTYVLTRIYADPLAADVHTCGSDTLPTESAVVDGAGCYASVSVFHVDDKLDASAAEQGWVLERLGGVFGCYEG